jgi:hypothetical protein
MAWESPSFGSAGRFPQFDYFITSLCNLHRTDKVALLTRYNITDLINKKTINKIHHHRAKIWKVKLR